MHTSSKRSPIFSDLDDPDLQFAFKTASTLVSLSGIDESILAGSKELEVGLEAGLDYARKTNFQNFSPEEIR